MSGLDLSSLEALARDRLQQPIVGDRPRMLGESGDSRADELSERPAHGSFVDVLDHVAGLREHARDQVDALARGEPVELHDLFLAMNKSNMAFEMMLEVRNKLVEAWQTLSRSVI